MSLEKQNRIYKYRNLSVNKGQSFPKEIYNRKEDKK